MKTFHPISAYMMAMSIIFLVLVTPAALGILIWGLNPDMVTDYGTPVWGVFIGVSVSCLLAVWIVCYLHRFEYLGIWKIKENGIFVTSFLGSRFNLSFEDIRYIGIEHCILSGTKQFWIYLSAHPIEKKYLQHINNMPIRSDCIRIQYSKAAYNDFLSVLPPNQKKQLTRACSVIRLYHADDE